MEIPAEKIQKLLDSMADSYLEENEPIIEEEAPKPRSKLETEKPPNKKPTQRFKSNPTIIGTVSVLFSREGKYMAKVQTVFNNENDGYFYRVDATGRTYSSHKLAVNNARTWLKKKRTKYYKKHPKERPRVRTVRLKPKPTKSKIKTIQKLYKMEKETAKILYRMSGKKLKIHNDYSRKKFESKKTTAVSGETTDFNVAIYNTMKDGTKKERKAVAKMLKKFNHEPFRKTNMFY